MSQEKPVEISADYTNINTSRKQAEVSGGVWSGNLIFQYKYNPAFHSRSRSILENLNPAPRLRNRSGKTSFSPNHRIKRQSSSRFLNSQKY